MRKSKFIPIFLKFVGATAEFGVYAIAALFDAFLNTPYKGTGRSVYYGRERYYKKNIQNLKTRGIIKVQNENFVLTPKGKRWAQLSYLRYVRYINPTWDKKWHVVIFDIPQDLHKARGAFRQRLKYLGFFPLQKSILVFPYPCAEDLGHICGELKISKYVDVLSADSLGGKEEEVKKFFDL